ncbi:hypothetical protein KP509_13G063200 [Ceratopteris richardii]|uniref:Uncharacterized protein n=1 Tax=Ceratopteris richardii TaxID=49495 RepID=A0A8T2TE34_CERRI|nr:hypothetical protein KP509_13G063200 [Ceratopteris richardii]
MPSRSPGSNQAGRENDSLLRESACEAALRKNEGQGLLDTRCSARHLPRCVRKSAGSPLHTKGRNHHSPPDDREQRRMLSKISCVVSVPLVSIHRPVYEEACRI